MNSSSTACAIIGGGAAGIGAARRLADLGHDCVILEARGRLGGRAHTAPSPYGPLDLGCGWLHSADRNLLVDEARRAGFTVDQRRPAWGSQWRALGFPAADQAAFRAESDAFYARLEAAALREPDRPAADFLAPGGRWNPLIDAIATYINGAELAQVSTRDYGRYLDTGENWRVLEGYGAMIERLGAGLPTVADCPVERVDHGGATLRITTPKGVLEARTAIVTLSTAVLAAEAVRFDPPLPDKVRAAHDLPLGVADKLFLSVAPEADLPADQHLFGATDRVATASFHIRPFGRPVIECFVGGAFASALEDGGKAAFADHAIEALAALLGSSIRPHLAPIVATAWRRDPLAGGSYSHALPGCADARAALAAPVDGRLFFAGEACHREFFSTAHGAFMTGVSAADAVHESLAVAQGR